MKKKTTKKAKVTKGTVKRLYPIQESRMIAKRLNTNYLRTLKAIGTAEEFLLWAGRYKNEFGAKALEVLNQMQLERYGLPVQNPFSLEKDPFKSPAWLASDRIKR